MKTLCFIHSGRADLPELNAYRSYFSERYQMDIKTEPVNLQHYDIVWFFMGFYRYKPLPHQFMVHEFASLSLPPLAGCKDWLKKQALPLPHLRIFQNENQRSLMSFRDQVPTLTRDMGISREFLQLQDKTKDFDLIYIGSMDKTRQLTAILLRLLSIKPDIRVAMVGDAPAALKQQFADKPQILFAGRVHHQDIPGWLERSAVGLNAVPNLRPYKFQTSTKLMEYAAAGLPVLGYLNDWTKNFLTRYSVQYADLDQLQSWPPQFENSSILPKINDELLWERVIERSGVEHCLPE